MNNDIPYKGANFYKCALQVNPADYNSHYRGGTSIDTTGYNDQMLKQCLQQEIKIVGLADHGRWSKSSTSLQTLLQGNDILVFPGFEIATSEKIHIVCLYSEGTNATQMNQYLGVLMGINNRELAQEPTYPSSLSCQEITRTVNDQGGFYYFPHVTAKSGLLKLDGGRGSYKHLWQNENCVKVIQIPGKIEDLPEGDELGKRKYRDIIENKNPDYKRQKPVAVINAKDVEKPETLSYPSASFWVKMTNPTFEAFKNAFHDHESRIRLNHHMPEEPCSFIQSIQWEGSGFFENARLRFSKNLNTIIGGRGTGKSTLIESIRYVLDLPQQEQESRTLEAFYKHVFQASKITLKIFSKAQSGQWYTISKRFGEHHSTVKNEQGVISHLHPRDILPHIRLLGQNEILEIEKKEAKRRELVYQFLPDNQQLNQNLNEISQRMKINRDKWIKANEEFEKLDSIVQREFKLKEQVKQYERLGIDKKLQRVRSLEREKSIQKDIENQIKRVQKWLEDYSEVFDLEFLQEAKTHSLPNEGILKKIREKLEIDLKSKLDSLVSEIHRALENVRSSQTALQEEWKDKIHEIQDELNHAIAQLPEQVGKLGKMLGREYTDIVQQLTYIDNCKKEHRRQGEFIEALKNERKVLLDEYREIAFKRNNALGKAVKKLNEGDLKSKLRLSLEPSGDLQPLKDFLKRIEGIGPNKVKWLDEIMGTPVDLSIWSEWIENKNSKGFMDEYGGSSGIQKSTVEKLLGIGLEKRLELEEIRLDEKVEIELNIADNGEENYRPLKELSTGQKCTAILNLLLLSCNDPLIVDQPEDHLDNAFIANRIVCDLRDFKTQRQFIFATHNANIPIFGDAELIAVLQSNNKHGSIKEEGSIDEPNVCQQAAEILEGGKLAFEMRRYKYGY